MFAPRYFSGVYFSRRYWPRGGTDVVGYLCGVISIAARLAGTVATSARLGGSISRGSCD